MKRITAGAFVCMLACVLPARAWNATGDLPAEAAFHSGSVTVPVVSARVALELQGAGVPNGTVADVFKVPAAADGHAYSLKRTAGLTGQENVDVFFYQGTATEIGDACTDDGHDVDASTETGTVCPRPQDTVAWAVVVLRTGARAEFDFSYAA